MLSSPIIVTTLSFTWQKAKSVQSGLVAMRKYPEAAEMHEKILRVLARLAFTVFEAFEFLWEADDVDVEIAQRNAVHIRNTRVVDVVEDIYLFGDLLK